MLHSDNDAVSTEVLQLLMMIKIERMRKAKCSGVNQNYHKLIPLKFRLKLNFK